MAINIHLHGLFIIIFIILQKTNSNNSDSEALLKLKKSFTNATSLDSWKPGTEPCVQRWVGVKCDKNGVVYTLRLGKLGLSGTIDIDALASLQGLKSIGFPFNSFSGPIPDFHKMGALKGLYMSGNQFSGQIPSDYFANMVGLKKVKLSKNMFSGPIPSSLAGLSQLMDVRLDHNQFSGKIPSLEQQNLVAVDFSNNNLEGEIPSSLSRFGAEAFEGNVKLCGGSLGQPCENNRAKIVILVIVGIAGVILLMSMLIFCMRRKTNEKGDEQAMLENPESSTILMDEKGLGFGVTRARSKGKGSRGGNDFELMNAEKGLFGMVDLMRASAEVLGSGSLGSSYKARLACGLSVVVKRVTNMNKYERNVFDVEMRKLGSLKHKNLLAPLGFYYRKDEKLLVNEYQHKGSLMLLLHGDKGSSQSELNCALRFKIIRGISRGLVFLHTELASLDLPHGDLKSSNVLLSQDYEPVLSDFGFYALINEDQAAESLIAYKSPEAIKSNHISPKCDVYFLGIIILEILTRKYPCQYLNNGQGGTDLVQWVRSAIAEGREAELLDPEIANATSYVRDMRQLLHISAACAENDPYQRLGLREAVSRIEDVCACAIGDQETESFDVSRDGYVDQPLVASHSLSKDSYKDHSRRRKKSIGDGSKFVFQVS